MVKQHQPSSTLSARNEWAIGWMQGANPGATPEFIIAGVEVGIAGV
jgi:hypothetical protein